MTQKEELTSAKDLMGENDHLFRRHNERNANEE